MSGGSSELASVRLCATSPSHLSVLGAQAASPYGAMSVRIVRSGVPGWLWRDEERPLAGTLTRSYAADQVQLEGSRRVLRVSEQLLEDASAGSPLTGIGRDRGRTPVQPCFTSNCSQQACGLQAPLRPNCQRPLQFGAGTWSVHARATLDTPAYLCHYSVVRTTYGDIVRSHRLAGASASLPDIHTERVWYAASTMARRALSEAVASAV
jgi:hypothetical protein